LTFDRSQNFSMETRPPSETGATEAFNQLKRQHDQEVAELQRKLAESEKRNAALQQQLFVSQRETASAKAEVESLAKDLQEIAASQLPKHDAQRRPESSPSELATELDGVRAELTVAKAHLGVLHRAAAAVTEDRDRISTDRDELYAAYLDLVKRYKAVVRHYDPAGYAAVADELIPLEGEEGYPPN
jgi:chromosome segregation ATPase